MTGVIKPGLERISKLLEHIPLHWRAIHVAGTNGKGTVCAYVSAMLDVYNKSSYRELTGKAPVSHGRFTSPHLVSEFDGITINGQQPNVLMTRRVCDSMRRRSRDHRIFASEFEILTATAFVLFEEHLREGTSKSLCKSLDIGVVEVGMGGRDDATNILGQPHEREGWRPSPLVTAISNIGLDHQDFLGSTLSEIARNKAGIMKPGTPVVFDERNDPEVRQVLVDEAGKERLKYNEDPAVTLSAFPAKESTRHNPANRITEGLPAHTKSNLGLAFKATWTALRGLDRTQRNPRSMDDEMRTHILALGKDMLKVHETVQVPGRLQSLLIEPLAPRKNPVLLDGAHNEQSALVLAEAVQKLRAKSAARHQGVVWVVAASKGKDLHTILKHLLRPEDTVFAVEFGPVQSMPWVEPRAAADIVDIARSVASLSTEQCFNFGRNVPKALEHAAEKANEGPLVVAGSLYLVGDVLRLLQLPPPFVNHQNPSK